MLSETQHTHTPTPTRKFNIIVLLPQDSGAGSTNGSTDQSGNWNNSVCVKGGMKFQKNHCLICDVIAAPDTNSTQLAADTNDGFTGHARRAQFSSV